MSSTLSSNAKSSVLSKGGFHRIPKILSPFLSLDFLERSPTRKASLAPIGCLPVQVQESIMVRELLSVLQGTTRDYICALPLESPMAEQKFNVDDSLDSSLKHYVQEMLPIASLYSKVARFVDTGGIFEDGMVVQAFAEAGRQFIYEYQNFMTDRDDAFRDGQLTMQRLNHHMFPLVPPFQALAAIIDLRNEKFTHGGAVLGLLFDRLRCFPSSPAADQLVLEIAKSAARPFLAMLSRWMYEGTFQDPYAEFMIGMPAQKRMKNTAKQIHDAAFWEKRYKIMTAMQPKFLEKYADKILRTGKYLNIIQQCGHSICDGEVPVLVFSMDIRYYEAEVDKAYRHASGRLLHLMLESENLLSKLRTFKHFFLLDEDDFLPEFLLYAADDLSLPVGKIDKNKVFAIFEDAIKVSVLHVDPHRRMMRPTLKGGDCLSTVHEMQTLSDSSIITTSSSSTSDRRKDTIAFSCFTMDCDIKFPLCLIVNDEAKIYYQALFQNLFRLKVVEWRLSGLWSLCVSSRNPVFVMCCTSFVHQMLDFTKSLQHYFSGEVIEPYWHGMMTKIRAAQTFDEVLLEHKEFIATCAKDCLLYSPDILRLLYKLLDTCTTNCSGLQDLKYVSSSANITSTVNAMQAKFCERVVNLLVMMSDFRQNREFEYKLVGAMHFIDFSGFYQKHLVERAGSQSSGRDFRIASVSSSSTTAAAGIE